MSLSAIGDAPTMLRSPFLLPAVAGKVDTPSQKTGTHHSQKQQARMVQRSFC